MRMISATSKLRAAETVIPQVLDSPLRAATSWSLIGLIGTAWFEICSPFPPSDMMSMPTTWPCALTSAEPEEPGAPGTLCPNAVRMRAMFGPPVTLLSMRLDTVPELALGGPENLKPDFDGKPSIVNGWPSRSVDESPSGRDWVPSMGASSSSRDQSPVHG